MGGPGAGREVLRDTWAVLKSRLPGNGGLRSGRAPAGPSRKRAAFSLVPAFRRRRDPLRYRRYPGPARQIFRDRALNDVHAETRPVVSLAGKP